MNKNGASEEKFSRELTRKGRGGWPRTLSAFHEAKVLAIYRCPTCHCDHYGISAGDAAASVAATNAVLASLNEEELEAMGFYGRRTASLTRFTRCFFCGTPADVMKVLGKDEPYSEPSPQPVIVDVPANVSA